MGAWSMALGLRQRFEYYCIIEILMMQMISQLTQKIFDHMKNRLAPDKRWSKVLVHMPLLPVKTCGNVQTAKLRASDTMQANAENMF